MMNEKDQLTKNINDKRILCYTIVLFELLIAIASAYCEWWLTGVTACLISIFWLRRAGWFFTLPYRTTEALIEQATNQKG